MQFTFYKKRETWMINNNIQLYSIERNSTEIMWYNVHHQTGIHFLKFDNSQELRRMCRNEIQYGNTYTGTQILLNRRWNGKVTMESDLAIDYKLEDVYILWPSNSASRYVCKREFVVKHTSFGIFQPVRNQYFINYNKNEVLRKIFKTKAQAQVFN